MEDIGSLIERLRKQVIVEADQRFADESFQHLRCSLYNERMRDADVSACMSGECGCSMEIYLKFRKGTVEKATYMTDGEHYVRLCGSCVADLATGKSGSQILKLTAGDVLNRLGRQGLEVERCALLALSALHKAASSYCIDTGNSAEPTVSAGKQLFISVGNFRYDN